MKYIIGHNTMMWSSSFCCCAQTCYIQELAHVFATEQCLLKALNDMLAGRPRLAVVTTPGMGQVTMAVPFAT